MEELPPLPWAPTVNTYYRYAGRGHAVISPRGRLYREEVALILKLHRERKTPHDGPLSIVIRAHRPDRRVRDLDNILKSLLDSIKHAGVFYDDSQVEHIGARLLPFEPGPRAGAVFVAVGPLTPDSAALRP